MNFNVQLNYPDGSLTNFSYFQMPIPGLGQMVKIKNAKYIVAQIINDWEKGCIEIILTDL